MTIVGYKALAAVVSVWSMLSDSFLHDAPYTPFINISLDGLVFVFGIENNKLIVMAVSVPSFQLSAPTALFLLGLIM